MNTRDDFQILRDERTKLVNEIADLQTENRQLRGAKVGLGQHISSCPICSEPDKPFCADAKKIIKQMCENHR